MRFCPSSKCVKIARLAMQRNPINQGHQRIKKKITFFLNSFSDDQINIFSELR